MSHASANQQAGSRNVLKPTDKWRKVVSPPVIRVAWVCVPPPQAFFPMPALHPNRFPAPANLRGGEKPEVQDLEWGYFPGKVAPSVPVPDRGSAPLPTLPSARACAGEPYGIPPLRAKHICLPG